MANKKTKAPKLPSPFPTALQLVFKERNSKKELHSKFMKAVAAHEGEVWVKDPMLLL